MSSEKNTNEKNTNVREDDDRVEASAVLRDAAAPRAPAPHVEESHEEEHKPEDAPKPASAEFVSVKVVSQDGAEVFFKIKKHTPLRKLMDAYCSRQGTSRSTIRFLYDGNRVSDDMTAKELGLEDGDIIDVYLQQTGGY